MAEHEILEARITSLNGFENERHVFIQWKNSDACFDFCCSCGGGGHYDGYFAYSFECPSCHQTFIMPDQLQVLEGLLPHSEPVKLEMYGD